MTAANQPMRRPTQRSRRRARPPLRWVVGAGLAVLIASSVGCDSGLDPSSEASATTAPPTGDAPSETVGPTPPPTATEAPQPVADAPVESALDDVDPIVIAHRGASGERPENTLAAFELAIDLGADFVEPDVVMSRDGHAIVRHDNQLDFTTDVADVPELAGKRTTKTIGGRSLTGWFAEDLTLEEIKMLRAVERDGDLRPQSARFDGQEEIPTLREVLELVVTANERESLQVGVYPELKVPGYLSSLGLDVGSAVLADLAEFGFVSHDDQALIQSFEVDALRAVDAQSDLRLVQLFAASGGPADQSARGTGLTFAAMATTAGLATVAEYADGVGVDKNRYVIPLDDSGALDEASTTTFVADAHEAGLFVHAYTFRAENRFLPTDFASTGAPNEPGDVVGEIRAFLDAGVDGVFVDQVDLGREAVVVT